MLKLITKLNRLSFDQLMAVYLEGNQKKAAASGETLLDTEQDFYDYLSQVFFPTPGAVYAIWEEGECYAAALRLEPYRDGLLLEALETAPNLRRRGYAGKLLLAVQREFSNQKIYSHIAKDNGPSLRLHQRVGFRKIADYAVYIDGSVNHICQTWLWENNEAGSLRTK